MNIVPVTLCFMHCLQIGITVTFIFYEFALKNDFKECSIWEVQNVALSLLNT